MTHPPVSVILPIRNERDFIERSLGAVLSQDYARERIQVLIADGMSDDGTREVVHEIIVQNPDRDIRLIDNPGRIVPTGFNRALAQATGEVIVRVDGHCEIAPDYVRRCVELLSDTAADCVGGPMETVGGTLGAQSIALAQSSRFGVGGVAFRTGSSHGRYVDTLAFGAYHREIFERLGGYDEELVRNQDDEFNLRLTQAGGRIWLDPSIHSAYYSRASLRRLWRQYYQYGFYKVRVIQKRGAVPSWRHLIPAAFVISLLLSFALAAVTGEPLWTLAVAGPYLVANILASTWTARHHWFALSIIPAAFVTLHVAYGTGFVAGIWRWRGYFRMAPAALQEASQ